MNNSTFPTIDMSLVLSGADLDTDECSDQLGLHPTRIWRPRRRLVRQGVLEDRRVWYFGIRNQLYVSIDDSLSALFEVVFPRREAIARYARRKGLTTSLVCNVTIHRDRALLELSRENLTKMTALEADFSLDIFDYSRDT